MKPVAVHGIYFQQAVDPDCKQHHKSNCNQVIDSPYSGIMRKNEHREQQHGEVCHEYEFILVDGNAFLVSVEKTGIYLTAKQLEDVRHEQQGKNHSNIGNERPLGNSARNKGLTKHCKACGYCDQIKCEHENGTSILNDFAFALQKGKMALGKQRPENEHQLPAEGEKRHRENKQ